MRFRLLAIPLLLMAAVASAAPEDFVQGHTVLTVAEGKRLIGRAVAELPVVKRALEDGMVIITKGTTNTYVAEAILGEDIPHGALVSGRTLPAKGGKRLPNVPRMSEIVLVGGEASGLPFAEAVTKLQPGDVVIKGANMLDYPNSTAGVLVGASNAGTVGTFMPYVVARKAHLVIPVGLEKQVAHHGLNVADRMRQPVESLTNVPSMFLMTGHIITEIEAIELLADVEASQVASGGVGGAEGGIWLLLRGQRAHVEKALELIEAIQGEPPFVE